MIADNLWPLFWRKCYKRCSLFKVCASKHSSNTVLCLLRNLMEQTLGILSCTYSTAVVGNFFVIHWISTLSLHIVYFAKILLVLQVNWLMFYDVYQISDVATDIIINRNADQRIPNTFTTHGGWIQNCSTVHDCKEKSPRIKGRS